MTMTNSKLSQTIPDIDRQVHLAEKLGQKITGCNKNDFDIMLNTFRSTRNWTKMYELADHMSQSKALRHNQKESFDILAKFLPEIEAELKNFPFQVQSQILGFMRRYLLYAFYKKETTSPTRRSSNRRGYNRR